MTRVDFYVLSTNNPHERRVLACRLAEKAWRQGMKVYIQTGSEADTEIMDKLLWTFRQGSFIPHQVANGRVAEWDDFPVALGQGLAPDAFRDLVINLSFDKPPGFEAFKRVAEVLDEDETVRAEGRVRYTAYKKLGFELESHKL